MTSLSPDSLINKLETLIADKDLSKAIDLANQNKDKLTRSYKLRVLLSTAYQRDGKYANAFKAAEEAIYVAYNNGQGTRESISPGQLRRA